MKRITALAVALMAIAVVAAPVAALAAETDPRADRPERQGGLPREDQGRPQQGDPEGHLQLQRRPGPVDLGQGSLQRQGGTRPDEGELVQDLLGLVAEPSQPDHLRQPAPHGHVQHGQEGEGLEGRAEARSGLGAVLHHQRGRPRPLGARLRHRHRLSLRTRRRPATAGAGVRSNAILAPMRRQLDDDLREDRAPLAAAAEREARPPAPAT